LEDIDLSAPVVMGILNLTPDSFSDGGAIGSVDEALEKAHLLAAEGAGIVDVGGESTRPGAEPVPVEVEVARILPFVEAAASSLPVPLSVDTRRAIVARASLRAGAQVINDVSGLKHDSLMAQAVAEDGGALVLSHMRGTPATMDRMAGYGDVVAEVVGELRESLSLALEAGIPEERIVVDPGIGFAKTGRQSLTLLRELEALSTLGRPVLVGPSRKSFIGEITGRPPLERLHGTVAACVVAFLKGARVFRVHDVGPVVQALAVTRAILFDREVKEAT
jgi:dihydropteroate synthase